MKKKIIILLIVIAIGIAIGFIIGTKVIGGF